MANEKQTRLTNEAVRNYKFLKEMYADSYFPDIVVDKGRDILLNLCFQIEQQQPKNLDELYELTHEATEEFNELQNDFADHDSEIETGARECIAEDFLFIAHEYGFEEADVEELIGTRDW